MKSSMQIRNEINECKVRAEALDELVKMENREFGDEETAALNQIHAQVEALNKQLDSAIKFESICATKMQQVDKRETPKAQKDERLSVPIKFARAKKPEGFGTVEDAYKAGQWILAAFCGNRKSKQYCKDNGLLIRNAMTTGDNTQGGFLVPEPLESAIIELRESYGVFARYAQPWTMTDAVQNVPKLNGEITSYYVGENTTITPSDMAFALVRLEARKLAAVGVVSSELTEDAVLSVAEAYARSVAFKFSYDEDNAGFNGTGSSTFGGIVGAVSALAAGSVVTTTAVTTVAALTLAHFEAAVGKLPEYAGIQPRWYMHKNTWAMGPQRLLDAVGGNSMVDIANGAPKQLLGYPVEFSQVLYNGAGASGETFAYFGDLRMSSILGRRRGMSMQVDNSIYFLQDATAIRATQRYDINVHDRGTASAAGALIALRFA